jgi:ABC-type transport system involved in cytochrome bd biosynthesis fused ATPase/permease subunit
MRISANHPLNMVTGLGLWLVWLGVVYGGLSVACAVAAPASALGAFTWVNGALLLLTLLATGLIAWITWMTAREARRLAGQAPASRQRFIAWVAAALNGIAAVSTVVVGLPLAWLPPCG